MSTNIVRIQSNYSIIENLPPPETPAQFCALYGYACLKASHDENGFPLPMEENPILNVMKMGMYPPDEDIKIMLPRLFLRLEKRFGPNYTLEDTQYHWRVEHRNDKDTPVSLVRLTKLHPKGDIRYSFGETCLGQTEGKISTVIFNHLGYALEVGELFFVHNHEITEPISVDFIFS